MDKISSLQSLSDYGLGDSDIEDSDEETAKEPAAILPTANSSRASSQVVTASSRLLVSYGEEDEERDDIIVEDIADSPLLVQDKTEIPQESDHQKKEEKDANENDVDDGSETKQLQSSNPNVVLPPEPTGRCSMMLQDKITELLEKKEKIEKEVNCKGVMNARIQNRKDFRNPSIYEKLVSYLEIQESGTNYPPALFDPDSWAKEPNYETLAKQQKEAYEKKEKAKRTQIEFLSGTKKPPVLATAATCDEAKKRKSKWDISAGPTVAPSVAPVLAKVISEAAASAAKKSKG